MLLQCEKVKAKHFKHGQTGLHALWNQLTSRFHGTVANPSEITTKKPNGESTTNSSTLMQEKRKQSILSEI